MVRTIKRLLLVMVLADNVLTNFVKEHILKSRYKLKGGCLKCGQCCRQIYLKATRPQVTSPLFAKLSVKWIEWLFDFELKQIDTADNYFVFGCKNIRPDGKCGNYFWRPNICRNYPLLDYFKEPVFLPRCGYGSKPRRAV